jgi:hypothetical protein
MKEGAENMGLKRVSKAKYWEMLEILPPAAMAGGGFLVGEPWDHDEDGNPRFEAYFERGGKHYVATVPMTHADFKKELAR